MDTLSSNFQMVMTKALNSLNDGVIITTPQLEKPGPIILFVNDTVLKITGYTREELIGMTPRLFQGRLTSQAALTALKTSLRAGREALVETINYRKDGSTYPVELNIKPIYDDNGALIYYLGIQRDISTTRWAEAAVLENEQLSEQLFAKEQIAEIAQRILSSINYEMRNPLATIFTSSDVLTRYGDRLDAEKRNQHLEIIRNEALYMSNVLDDVLAITMTGQEEQFEYEPLPLDLDQFCRDLVRQMDLRYPNCQMSYGGIENPACSVVECDSRLIRYILTNLLSNAAKYSLDNGQVTTELICEGDTIIIRVSDEGIGIPEEDLAMITTPFYRGKNAAGYKGAGLGLSIVKYSTSAHGGTMTIESAVGKGTTVSVFLPREMRAE